MNCIDQGHIGDAVHRALLGAPGARSASFAEVSNEIESSNRNVRGMKARVYAFRFFRLWNAKYTPSAHRAMPDVYNLIPGWSLFLHAGTARPLA